MGADVCAPEYAACSSETKPAARFRPHCRTASVEALGGGDSRTHLIRGVVAQVLQLRQQLGKQ